MGSQVSTIRSFEAADIEAAAALETANRPTPWSEDMFEAELVAENRVYLVADDDGLAGFGGVMVAGDKAHITNLLVDPAKRARGIGRRLMTGLIEAAVGEGAKHLTLEVRTRNEAARALYASLGMAPVGLRPGYYEDDDALILWAHDIDAPGYLEGLR